MTIFSYIITDYCLIAKCAIYNPFYRRTSKVTQKLDKEEGVTLHLIKINDPGNCNGKQKADRRGECEIKQVPIHPFPDTINTRWVGKKEDIRIENKCGQVVTKGKKVANSASLKLPIIPN